MNININGGHCPAAPGASGILDELTEDRKVVAALFAELRRRGHTVSDGSSNATTVGGDLAYQAQVANQCGAELAVSIHLNAGGGTGTEVWYYTGSAAGQVYANRISKAVADALGLPNRGAKATTGLYWLKHTKATAVLVEVCFVDTQADADAYNAAGPEKVAVAIADAIEGSQATTTAPAAQSAPAAATVPQAGNQAVRDVQVASVQAWAGATIDGIPGPETHRCIVKMLQAAIGVTADGIVGPVTKAHLPILRAYTTEQMDPGTKALQALLICAGLDTNGFDGIFGDGTAQAVRSYQGAHGLAVDGIVGPATWGALLA